MALPRRYASRKAPVREPDAGNLHVRFDERRGGDGPWVRLGEKASESGPSQQAPTNPSGTAPPADSTPLASLAQSGMRLGMGRSNSCTALSRASGDRCAYLMVISMVA